MNYLNTIICRGIVTSFAILSIPNGARAQSQDYPANKYTYLKNDFTIGYTAGINQSQFEVVTGNDLPEVHTGLVNQQEKRSIDPRSVFIGVSGGGSATYNKATADDFIKSSYQIGVKAAFTAEIGLSRSDYATGYKVKGPFNGEYTFNFLSALELNMGYGWRFISKNKFNFIDVSAGIQLGAHNFPEYLSSFLSDDSIIHLGLNGNESIVIQSKDEIQTNFIPLIYGKLNKNIRITNYLFFSAAMQYNIGFYPITKKTISYEYAGEQNINRELSLIMNGTGIQFTFGLKYKFVPKK